MKKGQESATETAIVNTPRDRAFANICPKSHSRKWPDRPARRGLEGGLAVHPEFKPNRRQTIDFRLQIGNVNSAAVRLQIAVQFIRAWDSQIEENDRSAHCLLPPRSRRLLFYFYWLCSNAASSTSRKHGYKVWHLYIKQ